MSDGSLLRGLLPRASRLSAVESLLRPALVRLPPRLAVGLYSKGRRQFVESFARERPRRRFEPPAELATTAWGLEFRSPLGNAAGLFKAGDGYAAVAAQGAGFYLAGTTTATPRTGNRRQGVHMPFAPYPRAGAASNWLGLPNPGHAVVAEKLARVERVAGCPIGASASQDPNPPQGSERALEDLVAGLHAYERAGVDFLEINESCPNTEAGDDDFDALAERLWQVAEHFLARRQRTLPVVVKLSTDTDSAQVPRLLDLLLELGFDGVNFGNTSIAYESIRPAIDAAEQPLYDYFTRTFGGGVSGRPLGSLALPLVEAAAEHLAKAGSGHELLVVRTGGVESADDVRRSRDAGAALVQWYTGYFEAFAAVGERVYERLYGNLLEPESASEAAKEAARA